MFSTKSKLGLLGANLLYNEYTSGIKKSMVKYIKHLIQNFFLKALNSLHRKFKETFLNGIVSFKNESMKNCFQPGK